MSKYRDNMVAVFGDPQLTLTNGEGCYVWDDQGNKYLDMYAGIAVNALGHNHPALTQTLCEQGKNLIHVSNFFTTAPQLRAAEAIRTIVTRTQANTARVFFTNSGTEANEAALKVVRLAHPKRTRVIALKGAFHGRTFGTMSITSKEKYRVPFEPLPFDAVFVDPTIDALDKAMDDQVAAIIMEPIQGEAGVYPLDHEVAWHARELCTRHNALLVVDEVQTGMGRTGQWMGHHMFDEGQATGRGNFLPDIVTLAKGLAGGVPIGAMVTVTKDLDKVLTPGSHGSTFGGNPLATACAATVIQTIDHDDLLTNVLGQGKRLRDWLINQAPAVKSVRGVGLLLGVELDDGFSAPDLVARGRAHGLLLNNTDEHTIRLAPPLIFTKAEFNDFCQRWVALCQGGNQ